ncbi:hypothetical protein HWV62_10489 [Athelia sp. TMB]|nr:hypothetical protein HWV62_10489 [Athelia sp. TMB]
MRRALEEKRKLRQVNANLTWSYDGALGSTRRAERAMALFRHTNVDLDSSGAASSTTSYITAPASPEKAPALDADLFDETDDMPALLNVEEDSDAEQTTEPVAVADVDLDSQYQQHKTTFVDLANEALARKTRESAENVNAQWLRERETFLRELLRLDGRGDYTPAGKCPVCCEEEPTVVRCEDCSGGLLLCSRCSVIRHHNNPTHRIEIWNGSYFLPTTLKALGLRIQLGHPAGECCINPIPSPGNEFVIVDNNGIHEVFLDFCGCTRAEKETIQLLRARLYPATIKSPQTAATFNVLEFFHLLTFDSKASAFEFYHALGRRTDNTGTMYIPDRYEEFLRMIHQWRNLKMLKRAGRGHDPEGVSGTMEGQCAVLCPACPQPGRNLPPDWDTAPQNARFLFALFLAEDANFRMVRKKISSEEADPTMSAGLSYFVEITKYRAHLATYGDQQEVHSTCVKHHAVGDANTSRFANLATSGIGAIDCSRHMIKRPNSVGDLQKGERTSQQDYVQLVMSYDIVCQWSINLWARMKNMPGYIQIDRDGKVFIFLVPKFHLPAHVERCQTSFSFNLTRGVGRTDGEAIERGWANINALAASAKQMGPASYRETIDDHFGDWNHQRIMGLGRLLLKKLKVAVPARDEHVQDFQEFTSSLAASSLLQWLDMVEDWERDSSLPNPFVAVTKSATLNDVRLALSQEDGKDLSRDDVHEEVTPGVFIASGLELEAQQTRLKADAKSLDASATSLQRSKVEERKNVLGRKVKSWTDIQQVYMPEVSVIRAREEQAAANRSKAMEPYDIPLHLPSALTRRLRTSPKLFIYEFRLRTAQAYEALDELRRHLRLHTHITLFKNRHVPGQRANTRSQGLLNRAQFKVNASAAKYKRARASLHSISRLSDDVGLPDEGLRELNPDDIRSFADDTDKKAEAQKTQKEREKERLGLGEGRKKMSWIWKVYGVGADTANEGLQEALRIEWCRTRGRAMRWSEEVLLIREEMRRVQAFFHWHASWWDQQGERIPNLSAQDAEGVAAYAARQAHIRLAMASSFDTLWRRSWRSIGEGTAGTHEILELEDEAAPFITAYPATDLYFINPASPTAPTAPTSLPQ